MQMNVTNKHPMGPEVGYASVSRDPPAEPATATPHSGGLCGVGRFQMLVDCRVLQLVSSIREGES